MAEEQPFNMLFETFGRTPLAHADSVNREASDRLVEWLDVPTTREGGCILLRAPRAGHGKTHLLSRVRHRFATTHEAILLRASRGYQIEATTVLEDVVRHLLDEQPGHLGLTRMDVLARRLMASALVPLVESGEVPCEDRQAAIDALRKDPLGTFDYHNPAAVTAQWAKESFPALSERLLPHLARACDLPGREINFWLHALFQHSSASLEDHRRHQILEDKARSSSAGEAGMMNRLEALLALMCLGKRVVLIADDLEGFSSDPSAALNLATLIMALRQSVPRLDVLVSLNQDVWEEVFVPCLSDGLADRLSERLVELKGLSEADMIALLDSRAPGRALSILAAIDREKAGTYARGLIREAGKAWQKVGAAEHSVAPLKQELPVEQTIEPLKQMPTKVQPKAIEPIESYAAPRPETVAPVQTAPKPVVAQPRAVAIEPRPLMVKPRPVVVDPKPVVVGPEPSPAESGPVEWRTISAQSAVALDQGGSCDFVPGPAESDFVADADEWEPVSQNPLPQAHQPDEDDQSRLEDPVGSLDPQDRARVEELLNQFRKKFGQVQE